MFYATVSFLLIKKPYWILNQIFQITYPQFELRRYSVAVLHAKLRSMQMCLLPAELFFLLRCTKVLPKIKKTIYLVKVLWNSNIILFTGITAHSSTSNPEWNEAFKNVVFVRLQMEPFVFAPRQSRAQWKNLKKSVVLIK